jgi:hypothetical protein
MKYFTLMFCMFLMSKKSFSQDSVTMRINSYNGNADIEKIMSFEGIALNEISLSGAALIGKNYEINIKEFKNGELVSNNNIINSMEDESFKVKSENFKFRITSKVDDDKKFKMNVDFGAFTSKKLIYNLFDKNGKYAVKNFLGSKPSINVAVNKKFYIMGLITPTLHSNGFSSYCEVAQSGIDPEKFHEKYNIPHYFLIEMVFK